MADTIRYDFSSLISICQNIIDGKRGFNTLNSLKKELNKFFDDSKCSTVTITKNTDKLFFGSRVYPIFNIYDDTIMNILFGDQPMRIVEYDLELDEKLFNPLLDIQAKELVAILLHEVGHIVNTSEPIKDIRKTLDQYMEKNKDVTSIQDSLQYKETLAFGIKEFIAKRASLFNMQDDEIMADEFVYRCGFNEQLDSVMNKISAKGFKIHGDSVNPFSSMMWVLSIYKQLAVRRLGAMRLLSKCKKLTASTLEKKEIENVIKNLETINISIDEAGSIKQAFINRISKSKRNSMKQFEDDFYELLLRTKNVEDEDEAVYILRKINVRMSLLDDYLNTEKLSDEERNRWTGLMDKFSELREKLSKENITRGKSYGLFINYPDIVPNRY